MSDVCVPGHAFSVQFLNMIGAPPMTKELAFKVEATGMLKCVASYYTDIRDELAVKEWTVRLEKTSPFYRMIVGEL